jgi:hypothetical protein
VTDADILAAFAAADSRFGRLSVDGVSEAKDTEHKLGAGSEHFKQFRKCHDWFKLALDKRSGSKLTAVGSYFLKHVVERWGGASGECEYVSNGVLIAAAVYSGAQVASSDGSVNVIVSIPLRLSRALGTCSRAHANFSFERFHDSHGRSGPLGSGHELPVPGMAERGDGFSLSSPWKDRLPEGLVKPHLATGTPAWGCSSTDDLIRYVTAHACLDHSRLLLSAAQRSAGMALHEEGFGNAAGSPHLSDSFDGPQEQLHRHRLGLLLATRWLHRIGADIASGKQFLDSKFKVYFVADLAAGVAEHFEDPDSHTECGELTELIQRLGVGPSVLSVGVVTAALINYGAQVLVSFDMGSSVTPAVAVRTTVPFWSYSSRCYDHGET